MRPAAVATLLAALLLGGCGIPRDPEGTLERVRGGSLRVGVTAHEPWVKLDAGQPGGVEAELVERFAAELDAQVEWVVGEEAELIAALHVRELDLVVGGLTHDSPWAAKVSLTRPYHITRVVVAVPAGEPVPEDIAGLKVAVDSGDEAAGILDKTDAIPVRVDDVTKAKGPVAVDDWLLDDLSLADTGVHLRKSKHVMAVPLGENGFLVRLERFLHDHKADVARLLDQEGRPR